MAAPSFLTSFASGVRPAAQRRREAALLEAAGYGECHLHVSTLQGDVLALGAFHRSVAATAEDAVWRRRTGGRVVACGDGFVVVSLGLPHRSSLVSDARWTLRPEQVMNRCVRGVLAWLRGCGVDATYPGLDQITFERRTLAHVSFAESGAGPTLFQAVVAVERTFAATTRLLDRVDPDGRVPADPMAEAACTCLVRAARGAPAASAAPDVAALTGRLGAAYAATFGGDVAELDPAVSEQMVADPRPVEDQPVEECAGGDAAPDVLARGVLGQVGAALRVAGGRIASASLTGDFIAPAWAVRALRDRLVGQPATAAAVAAVADSVLDGERGYLLGLEPAALRDLLARAVAP